MLCNLLQMVVVFFFLYDGFENIIERKKKKIPTLLNKIKMSNFGNFETI